jgi:hypothetical protein
MFGSILLRIGTYLVETFIGTGAVKDGGIRLENVKNAIETKINDVKKTTEIGNIKNTLADILEADDKTVRSEKVDAIIKQIDEINFVQPPKIAETSSVESISSKLFKILTETSLYKLALGMFLVVLLISPTWIKNTIEKSELGRVFRSTLTTVSANVRTVKVGNWEIGLGVADNVSNAKTELSGIDLTKITDGNSKQKITEAINHLTNADKTLKIEVAQNDKNKSENQAEGWVYLGKTKDKQNLLPDGITVSQSDLQTLKANTQVNFTDGVYLRSETKECPRSKGDIITSIPAGETFILSDDASKSLCEIGDTKIYAVWAKVRKN